MLTPVISSCWADGGFTFFLIFSCIVWIFLMTMYYIFKSRKIIALLTFSLKGCPASQRPRTSPGHSSRDASRAEGLQFEGMHLEMGPGLPRGRGGQKEESWAERHTAAQGSSQKELSISVALGGNELPITGSVQTKNQPNKNPDVLVRLWQWEFLFSQGHRESRSSVGQGRVSGDVYWAHTVFIEHHPKHLHRLTDLIFKTALRKRVQLLPHFTDEDIEAEPRSRCSVQRKLC